MIANLMRTIYLVTGCCMLMTHAATAPLNAIIASSRVIIASEPISFLNRKFVVEPGWNPPEAGYYEPYRVARDKLSQNEQNILKDIRKNKGCIGFDPGIDVTDGNLPKAVFLDVYRSSMITDPIVHNINLLPKLEYLDLFYSHVSVKGISALASDSLRSICFPMRCVSRIAADRHAWREMTLSLPHLHHLDMPVDVETVGKHDVLELLRNFPELESMHLLGAAVTDSWLEKISVWTKYLQGPEHIRGFGLRCTSVTGKGLASLEVLPNLTHLAIVDANMKAEHLQGLKSLTKLEELHLSMDQLHDSDLSILQALPKLRVLVLDHSPITDEGMGQIAKVDRLEFLSIVNTKISPKAAEEWRKASPGRKVRQSRGIGVETLQGWMQGLEGIWDDYHMYKKYPWICLQ